MCGNILAKITACTPYIRKNIWFWPTLPIAGAAGGAASQGTTRATSAELSLETAEADEAEWACAVGGAWPFQTLCDQLCVDMLDSVWEVRPFMFMQSLMASVLCMSSRA